MVFNLSFFLGISCVLFLLGLLGIILNRKYLLNVLLCVELTLLAVNLNFVFFSVFLDDIIGQLFALIVLTIAAAESAVGLAILIIYFRVHSSLDVNTINLLQS